MTFWLVLGLALLAMLSPVVWLRPSPRDRRLVGLREAAREAGVSVHFGKPPLHEPEGGVVAYRWRYPQTRPGPRCVAVRATHASEALRPCDEAEGWRWRIEPLRPLTVGQRDALAAALAPLPADALVLESTRDFLWLWWRESQSAAAFDALDARLGTLRDALAGNETRRGPPSAPC